MTTESSVVRKDELRTAYEKMGMNVCFNSEAITVHDRNCNPVGESRKDLREDEMKKTINCWEYMLCGRELGGTHVSQFGVCPAATDSRFAGIHGGHNAGRACWVVAGSMCKGAVKGTFAKISKNYCGRCDFYYLVKKEEGEKLLPTIFLLDVLDQNEE